MTEAAQAYARALATGASPWKAAVRVVATTPIVLSGEQPIDGVQIGATDSVLVNGQTDKRKNGIYDAATGAWVRRADASKSLYIQLGMRVPVLEGTFRETVWKLSSPTTGTVKLDSTPLEFTQDQVPLANETFSPMLGFDQDRFAVHNGDGSSALVLAISSSATPKLGATYELLVPAGSLSSPSFDAVASDLNTGSWETLDIAADYKIFAVVESSSPLRISSSGKNLGLRDVAVPTIGTRTVAAGAPTHLVVSFSERMVCPTVEGLSLTGTARTILSVSGDGSDTLTFVLSGALTGEETLSFVIGSARTLQDLNGNKIAAGTYSVSFTGFDFEMPGQLHLYKGDSMSTSGSDVLQVNDQIGSLHLVASATRPTTVTVGGKPGFHLVTNSYVKGDLAGSENLATFAIFIVARLNSNSGGHQIMLMTGRNSDVTQGEHSVQFFAGSAGGIMRRKANEGTGDLTTVGGINTSLHALLFTGNNSDAEYYRDVAVANATEDDNVTGVAIKRLVVGVSANLSSNPMADLDVLEIRVGNVRLTGSQVTDLFTYAAEEYGL